MGKNWFGPMVMAIFIIILIIMSFIGCAETPSPTGGTPTPAPTTAAPAPTTAAPAPTTAAPAPTTAAPAPSKLYTWKIGEPYPKDTLPYKMTKEWTDAITAASGGRMRFELYPGSLLGTYIDQIGAVRKGYQEWTLAWVFPEAVPGMDWNTLGYMYKSYEDAQKAWSPGGWAADKVNAVTLAKFGNLKSLWTEPTGLGDITSKKKFDPLAPQKGVKGRTPGSDCFYKRYEAQGFQPVFMSMAETEQALLTGTVDAVFGISSEQTWQYRAGYKYMYNWNDFLVPMQMLCNINFWNALPKQDQDIILKASADWTKYSWTEAKKRIDEIDSWLPGAGIEIVSLTDDEWNQLAQIALKAEIPVVIKASGADVMDVIRTSVPWMPK